VRYELRRNGHVLKLEKIPMELLILLVGRHGELVSRDEIVAKLWGRDVFVETDHGINTAIRKIRLSLGDDPDRSRFVQTVVGKGYRFIASVRNGDSAARVLENGRRDEGSSGDAMPATNENLGNGECQNDSRLSNRGWSSGGAAGPIAVPLARSETTATCEKSTPPGLATPERRQLRPSRRFLLSVAIVGTAVLFGAAAWRFRTGTVATAFEIVPLSGLSGSQSAPSFSPDGNQVAFALGDTEKPGIYTALIGGENPLRLTNDHGDRYPAWSPDGRQVAFSRPSSDGKAIYVVPALGGTERKVYSGPATVFPWSLSWSADGNSLAFSESSADRTHARISLLSLADSSITPLTFPSQQELDYAPAISPDGSTLAFVRSVVTGMVSDLYVVRLVEGKPKRITFANRAISCQLAWSADSSEIVFSSNQGGDNTLWRISASGGTAQPIAGVGAGAIGPTLSPKGNWLAYWRLLRRHGVWRLELHEPEHTGASPVQVISAKGLNGRPDFSPDGKKFAFESDRLGYHDIWSCDSDGSHCEQLTSMHGLAGAARWSPDGRYIAFEFRPKNHSEIFLVEVPGGRPYLLPTLSGSDNGGPSWSRDGKWIYFYSDHGGGPLQLWKVSVARGGPPVQVTKNGGVFAIESQDRRFLYYSKFDVPGIWKMAIDGGAETRILDQPDGSDWYNWGLAQDGIYFADSQSLHSNVYFLDFATGRKTAVYTSDKRHGAGLAISHDGRFLLDAEVDFADSSIMLVKNFR